MSDDRLVREVWKTFPHRAAVGHALVRRVGARGWEPPAWGRVHARFFARCGVPDPFDPGAVDPGTGLGDVGLATPRREPAPHAAPPAPKAAPGPRLPNLPGPSAPAPAAAPMERKDGKAAPRIGEVRRDDTADLKQKLQQKERLRADPARANAFKVQQPVARIPVRPGVAGADGEGGTGVPVPVRRAPSAGPIPTPPGPGVRPASAPSRPFAAAMRPSSAPRPGTAPDVVGTEVGDPFAGAPPVRPPAPVAPAPVVAPASRPAPPPVARPAPRPPPAPASEPVRPPTPAPPPTSSAAGGGAARPPARGSGGLDDLFGMGAGGDATRIRMPKAEDAAAAKPRRPTVVDPSQAPGGVDRRPPPARPPGPVPSATAPSSSTNEGPDED